jgi:hypothetical protein
MEGVGFGKAFEIEMFDLAIGVEFDAIDGRSTAVGGIFNEYIKCFTVDLSDEAAVDGAEFKGVRSAFDDGVL